MNEGQLWQQRRLEIVYFYVSEKGHTIHTSNFGQKPRDNWIRNIECLTWHMGLLGRNRSLVAITRNVCPQICSMLALFLPTQIANVVVEYAWQSLRRKKKKLF